MTHSTMSERSYHGATSRSEYHRMKWMQKDRQTGNRVTEIRGKKGREREK